MNGLDLLCYFFGGAFLVNALPHLVNGVSGRPFQTPFAKPPGKGLSSSTVNVLWAAFNLIAAYGLLVRVGSFDAHDGGDVTALGTGALVMMLIAARIFGPLHGGDLKGKP
jgi:hypothetical protein